jgi:thiamine biosynthesis lipoprotein
MRYQFLILTIVIISLTSCDRWLTPEPLTTFRGRTMGTTYQIKFVTSANQSGKEELQTRIKRLLQEINLKMSTYIEDSELSRFNRFRDTKWFELSPKTIAVIEKAIKISQLSGGAFDITVGALVELWGFGKRDTGDKIPTDNEIQQLLRTVNYQRLELRSNPPAIRKSNREITIDLSAIAKGYAVDQVSELIERAGIINYLVEIGGEIRSRGEKVNGKPWIIAIEKPLLKHSAQQLVSLKNESMATSGDYRNYFEKRGVRYSHTLDPKTGRPIVHNLASVSVIAKSCMLADGWATAFMVLGLEKGMELAKTRGMAVYFISRSKGGVAISMTPQFKKYLFRREINQSTL